MTESLFIDPEATKEEKYRSLLPQIEALIAPETDLIANLANISAALKQGMNFFWVGFYIVRGKELVLGPFQGPVACTRIPYGKGVCGTCWSLGKTLIVPDVTKFPGHIACSTDSKSEIVVPFFEGEQMSMILDVDSDQLDGFDEVDQRYLERIGQWL